MKRLTHEQTRTRMVGTGTGTAKSTRGLPVMFTSCERVFSNMKIKQTQHRNHLNIEKLEKMTKVS